MGLTVAAVRVNSIINSLFYRDMVVMAPSLKSILGEMDYRWSSYYLTFCFSLNNKSFRRYQANR